MNYPDSHYKKHIYNVARFYLIHSVILLLYIAILALAYIVLCGIPIRQVLFCQIVYGIMMMTMMTYHCGMMIYDIDDYRRAGKGVRPNPISRYISSKVRSLNKSEAIIHNILFIIFLVGLRRITIFESWVQIIQSVLFEILLCIFWSFLRSTNKGRRFLINEN